MTNEERFESEESPAAAILATFFAAGCGSRSAAWNWADRAINVLSADSRYTKSAVALKEAAGEGRFPDTRAMEDYLKARFPKAWKRVA